MRWARELRPLWITTVSEEQLLTTAKEQWPDAADYIYSGNGDNMLDEFMKGKILCRRLKAHENDRRLQTESSHGGD